MTRNINHVSLRSRGNLVGCASRRIERRAESGIAQGGALGQGEHVAERLVRLPRAQGRLLVGDYRLSLPY